jgi:hypothetical protein
MPTEWLQEIGRELGGRGVATVFGLIVGSLITAIIARWRRRRERQSILRGDARDTVVIHLHLAEAGEETDSETKQTRAIPKSLRIRALGQSELNRVVPNGHLAAILLARAWRVTPHDTLISMAGAEGSYLLETMTGYVCDRTSNCSFDHDLYVMAPSCEPKELSEHQPITIILISVADLALFERWPAARNVLVEHGSDGSRVLTLFAMANRFRDEQKKILELRAEGKRTKHTETMYVLDLALDRRTAPIRLKQIPWGRLDAVLKELNLE